MYNARVVSLVYYEHQAGEYVLPHHHNYYEMVFYKEGSGCVNVKGEKNDYQKDSVFVIKPYDQHDEINDTFSIVYICLFEADQDLENMFISLDEKSSSFVHELFEIALSEYKNQSPLYQDYVNHLFNLILIESTRHTMIDDQTKTNNLYVKHAKKYMRENYVKDIDFNMLAISSGYSYDRFRHIFKEVSGVSLNQYVLNIRLDVAKNLLYETDDSVKEIAQKCGFSDDSRFVNFFTQRMNLSPLRFRKMIREENEIGVVALKKKEKED
jgi:AraC-like DNA-binding protein